eukprot:m.136559 g.136559  ORF g.136559 m.136559 type:complete len:50 (+) comp16976_c2_seq2:2150-2299(+)
MCAPWLIGPTRSFPWATRAAQPAGCQVVGGGGGGGGCASDFRVVKVSSL